MQWWNTLRSALSLAARVDKLQKRVEDLEWQWGETLDKLLAREERFRKRYRSAVNAALTDDEEPAKAEAPPSVAAPVDRRAEVREKWRQQRAAQRG